MPKTTLTNRERQVLLLIAQEYSSKEAGEKLRVSCRTIQAHRANIARRLGTSGTAAFTQAAIVLGLITPQMPAGYQE